LVDWTNSLKEWPLFEGLVCGGQELAVLLATVHENLSHLATEGLQACHVRSASFVAPAEFQPSTEFTSHAGNLFICVSIQSEILSGVQETGTSGIDRCLGKAEPKPLAELHVVQRAPDLHGRLTRKHHGQLDDASGVCGGCQPRSTSALQGELRSCAYACQVWVRFQETRPYLPSSVRGLPGYARNYVGDCD
jgi:hypothetical protein